jgi:Ca-activated chloride channel family protein
LFKFCLLVVALAIGIIGLANLQAGSRTEKIERKGIDVMIALDVSKSMLAQDLSPNRLEKAKQFIARLLEKLGNDRIGLITFAGRAYVSVPLTVDMSALKMNLAGASPTQVPTQGTVIGEAISMARQSFNAKETKYKSIILISDGEDHDEGVADEVKKAVGEGIMINTVGIGSPEGSPIFDPETRANKRDEKGDEVISKLNEKELQEIASAAQGVYLRLGNTDAAADAIAKQISSTEQKNFGDNIFTDYNSYYQYFIGIALLLILIEFFIPEQKKLQAA